ncbi:MAG: hypothetical protein ABIP55_04065 [Tepidisphaeraceae bacterium]
MTHSTFHPSHCCRKHTLSRRQRIDRIVRRAVRRVAGEVRVRPATPESSLALLS